MIEYYAAVKKNKAVTYVLIWSNLQGIWISKNSNAQRFATICVNSFYKEYVMCVSTLIQT